MFGRLEKLLSMQSTAARGTALAPLQWLAGILGTALVGAIKANAPTSVVWTLLVLLIAVVVVFLVVYCVFASRNPDALRSEKYALSRMALERGLIGDDRAGLHDPAEPGVGGSSVPIPVDSDSSKKVGGHVQ